MNVKDKLMESLCNLIIKEEQKEKLTEFSMSKKYIIDKLYDMRLEVNQHLICCYFWYNTENYNHWKTEISAFIKTQPTIKGTNKYPTEKQLRKWVINDTIEEINNKIDGIVKRTEQDEKVKIRKYDKDILINYLTEFWVWLAKYLADGNDVMSNDIYNKIDFLVDKYKQL